ncbi:hypothetical protein [Desulfoscipio gibsoniae]|uniref:Uncharacterized protein n=1 Tax=Desulfoscipio gibsoniae DSM 7213 TaxID=767817 RepID=R4K8Z0_9FIRM|nr:hypothetical protein [Desulfoscipio gibsoniae]AGK99647.1 hypothetical protein Desgi_0027 [Desulfoscipio gibsoniae DSM 7213]
MSRIKKATEQEWRTIANEARELRDRIGKLSIQACPYLPVKLTDDLMRAQQVIDLFRARAEDEMFKRGGIKDTDIWYPGK